VVGGECAYPRPEGCCWRCGGICAGIEPDTLGGIPKRGDCGAISESGGRVVFDDVLRWPPELCCGGGSWFIKASIVADEYLLGGAEVPASAGLSGGAWPAILA